MSIGVFVALLSLVGGSFVIFQYLTDWTIIGFNPRQARGWTSLIFLISFSSAVQLICLDVLGEYLGRLFEEVKNRPVWLVKKRVNLPAIEMGGQRWTGR
jgi:dolichol-phosphate mannosyltransferase